MYTSMTWSFSPVTFGAPAYSLWLLLPQVIMGADGGDGGDGAGYRDGELEQACALW